MTGPVATTVASGALLSPPIMDAGPVRVLAAFVAINTVMYCALAVAKILPRLHPSTWLDRANRRGENRGIYPPDWTGAVPALVEPVPAGPAAPGGGVRGPARGR